MTTAFEQIAQGVGTLMPRLSEKEADAFAAGFTMALEMAARHPEWATTFNARDRADAGDLSPEEHDASEDGIVDLGRILGIGAAS